MASKRKVDELNDVNKKTRSTQPDNQVSLIPFNNNTQQQHTQLIQSSSSPSIQSSPTFSSTRTSLSTPLLSLSGHIAPIYCSRFHSSGRIFASVGAESRLFLWSYPIHNSTAEKPRSNLNLNSDSNSEVPTTVFNYGTLNSHQLATLDCDFHYTSPLLYTASADHTVHCYEVETGQRLRNFRFHSDIVNSVRAVKSSEHSQNLFISGSNDCRVHIYDSQSKHLVHKIQHDSPALSVEISGNQYYYGGLDNTIHCRDIRTHKLLFELSGHSDSVTNLRLNSDSAYILSSSHDNTLKAWDVQSFCSRESRLLQSYSGSIQLSSECDLIKACWSNDDQYVISGSADRCVWMWNTQSGIAAHRLPGHKATVLAVDCHPTEPVLLSCSTDRTMILGEM